MQSIVRNYYEQLYAKKFENQGEMDKFLAKCNLPKLNEEKGESLNRPVTAHETEAVIKKTPSTSKLWTRWFHRKILQNFKEELTTILPRLF